MAFEKFKTALKEKPLEELEKELLERKKMLFKWNQPVERRLDLSNELDSSGFPKTKSKHPFNKVKKEIAILNTIIQQRREKK